MAEKVGVTAAHISKIETGRSAISTDVLERIAKALGVPMAELVAESPTVEFRESLRLEDVASQLPPTIDLQQVPVYESVHAGDKSPVLSEPPVDYIGVTPGRDKSLFGVRVVGDCMHPAVSENDVVIVSKRAEPKNGDLCLVNFSDHEYILRRVELTESVIVLTAQNPIYPPIVVDRHKVRSILRVVGLYRDLMKWR